MNRESKSPNSTAGDEASKILQQLIKGQFQEAATARHYNPNDLKHGIEVVTVDNTSNWFPRDPLAEIFHFRGIGVDELGWRDHIHFMDTPIKRLHSETDNSDMQGTVYFVKRFIDGDIACVVRVHPSIDKYGRDISMIGNNLPHLIDHPEGLPLASDFFETSRVIVDNKRLPVKFPDGQKNPDRRKAFIDCLAASAIYCASQDIKGFFCFMPTKVWEVAYKYMGLEVIPLGGKQIMRDRPDMEPYEVYAGKMLFTDEAISRLKRITGFSVEMLDYGTPPEEKIRQILHRSMQKPASDIKDDNSLSL